ncbi:MAG: glycosyltransferase [Bacillota bacterium]
MHSSPVGKAGGKDTGGMSTYLRGLSGALGEMGHEVDLFTRMAGTEKAEVRALSPGVRLLSIDDGAGPLSKNELYPHLPAVIDGIEKFRLAENNSYDLVFSHYWLSGCAGRELCTNWKVPHLVMFHTLGRAKNEACRAENEPNLRLMEEEKLAYSSDLVIVAAPLEKERIIDYYSTPAERIAVIPCGVDRQLFRPLSRPAAREAAGLTGNKVILATGRIEPVKGYELLIRAAALLPAEDKVKVVIIGGDRNSNDQVAHLKELAADQGISDRLIFTGLVEHETLPQYYNAADVTVIPSFYESFGLVALESLACGTPLVAGLTGIFPELLKPYTKETYELLLQKKSSGILLDNRTLSAWAEAIRSCYLHHSAPIDPSITNDILAPYNWRTAAYTFTNLIQKI